MDEQPAIVARGPPINSAELQFGRRFIVVALLVCCGIGLVSVALGPDNNWDLRYYHLYAPWAYLHGRYLYDIGPAQYQGFFNPIADFLFYGLVSSPLNETPRVIAFIMGAVHGVNAALVLAIAFRVIRPSRPEQRQLLVVVALLIGSTGAGFISMVGTTTNDLFSSIFVLGCLLVLLGLAETVSKPRRRSRFAVAGLMSGIGLGLKYTTVVYMPGLTFVALVAAVRGKSTAGLVAFAIAVGLGLLAVAGHHQLTLWQLFSNPVFPLFNNVFQSPFFEPIALRDKQFLPRDFWQAVTNPFLWTRTNIYLVSELRFRDWRGAIAYVAIAAGICKLAAHYMRHGRGGVPPFAETCGLGLVAIFVVVSFITWELTFSIYRYAVVLEMLTGVIAVGVLMGFFEAPRLRFAASLVMLILVTSTTIHLDWGRGKHPSAGIRPAAFGDRYIDVRVPTLPKNSVVLLATGEPAAYFIPYAEPTARYLGIENNYLRLSQENRLVSEVKRLMRAPGSPKFIVSVGKFDGSRLSELLRHFGLRLGELPCQPIRSNLEEHVLSLCPTSGLGP